MSKTKLFLLFSSVILIGIIYSLLPKDILKNIKFSKNTPSSTNTPAPTPKEINISKVLIKLNSTINQDPGTAIIEKKDKEISVNLNIPETQNQYLGYLYKGTCQNLSEIWFPLANINNGTSDSALNTSITSVIKDLPLSVVVKSEESKIIYCGDILIR